MEVSNFAPGFFNWLELQTSDGAAAKSFYEGLFGWTSVDSPMGDGEFYTMLKLKGQNAGGLFQDIRSGAPPHWNCYISTENADNCAAKAKSIGGTIVEEPFDVMSHGRMAVIQDPTGAYFSVWEAKDHHGASIIDEPGAHCWTELLTTDNSTALAFYKELFGWGANTGDPQYIEFTKDGKTFAGMMQITPEMGPRPASWTPYFQVTDTDAARDKASSLGAKVLLPGKDIENVGRFAVIEDPQGAVFNIIQIK